PPLARGERGHAVALLQAALIQLGYPMPMSTTAGGGTDGIYGDETADTVRSFQSDATITIDGIAGHQTLSHLDGMLPAAAPPKAAPPPPPPPSVPTPYPSSHDFKIGSDDPPMHADKGAGKWNSKPKSALTYAAMVGIFHALPFARVALGKDAVKHMEH